jgi:flagellar assembly protein FliH
MANIDKNVEEQLLQLVVQLTEAVVLHEAKVNPDILIAAISAGIKALPSQEAQTQIYCHPDDIKLIEKEFGAEHIKESGWRLLPTPQLAVGSCQIENSTSNIDLSVKSRLKQVLDSFLDNALHHSS